MNKYRTFMDPLKEEQWINDFQAKGYKLKSITWDFIYTFEKSNDDYVTRVDYQGLLDKNQFEEYVSIHEEFGWQHIRGGRYGMMTQVWSKVPDGNDEIYSDKESKISFYKRYANVASALAIVCIIYMFLSFQSNPSSLFLTPELWDMTGIEFWRAFLFELPFVLLRLLPVVLFPIMAVIFFISYSNMNKAKKELEQE